MEVEKESILQEIKSILKIVGYSTKGEPLTKEEYINTINDFIERIKNGEKTYTTEEVREYVLNKKNR